MKYLNFILQLIINHYLYKCNPTYICNSTNVCNPTYASYFKYSQTFTALHVNNEHSTKQYINLRTMKVI